MLDQIHKAKGYSPAIEIENADVCVNQIALVDNKPTVFLSNFSGIKGDENADQFPDKDIVITFTDAKRDAKAVSIPFMGQPEDLKGEWKNGKLKVILPEIFRGAIVQLQ